MALMTLSVPHGHTFDEARTRLETTVHEVRSRFSALVRRVEWSTDRSQVRLEGIGFWIEMQVDAQAVHVSADIPVLGRLLGGSVTTRLKELSSAPFSTSFPRAMGKPRGYACVPLAPLSYQCRDQGLLRPASGTASGLSVAASSPDSNPIEKLWKKIKQQDTPSALFPDF